MIRTMISLSPYRMTFLFSPASIVIMIRHQIISAVAQEIVFGVVIFRVNLLELFFGSALDSRSLCLCVMLDSVLRFKNHPDRLRTDARRLGLQQRIGMTSECRKADRDQLHFSKSAGLQI